MSAKNYWLISGVVFAVIAVLHLARSLMGWDMVINGAMMPMWVSWVGVIVFGYLAYYALSAKKK